jgi:hypothetical protein
MIVQDAPFHCSMRRLRFVPVLPVEYPTATRSVDEMQLTLWRIAR